MWCALGSISFCRGLDQRGCGCVVDSDAGTCAAAIKSRADRVRFDHGCTYCLFRICTHIHTYVALEPQFMVGTMVERLSCDYLSYKMDYTGSQMMATIKLTSFAWFYTDGSSNPEAMKKELAEMKASLRVRAKLNTDADKRIAQARKNYELFGAPVGIFVTVHKSVGPNGWGHVGHLIQNICLASVDAGLATCLQEAWAGFPNLVKEHVGYSDEEILWCGIALGYEDPNHPVNSFRTEREKFESYAKILE